ncbi:MAG TPA: RNB domain-containing ribonuclease, partial [Planctomycetota bacterium]|nr:RNB domain-containing ribonuclease [Planctomycetota bacterium]
MIDARTVIAFLSRRGYRPVPLHELAKQVNVTGTEDRRQLETVVTELEADGVISRRKKKGLTLARPKQLVTGTIDVKRRGFAFVRPVGTEGPDLFVGPNSVGGALDGDLVLAEKLKPRRRGRTMLESGKVVQVLERRRTRLVGTLRTWRRKLYVVPDGMAFPAEIALGDRNTSGASEGDKVIIELSPRPRDGLVGRIVEVLGDGSDPAVDVPMIIAEFGLRTEFPGKVLHEAAALPGEVSAADTQERTDLRRETTVTIDPESAQDFDDAISVKRTRGGWKLGVHIADVSHYVRPGSALWQEAVERTTSIYLPTRTIPMLPERISNNLCSLRPDEDRLTLSVLMDLDTNGKVKAYRVVRSVIRSSKRLTYEEALAAITDESSDLDDVIVGLLRDGARLAKLRNTIRVQRGALELELPEVQLEYGEGHVVGASPLKRDVAHRMIEEFMLLA